jgi:DNA repair exonuclease SbcCD ATPase subunit
MSTVVLQSLEWDKCFSFGESNRVELSKEAVTQIIAPNGFGKSSIPLIVEEALYNKNSKGSKKSEIANRLLDGSYAIRLRFQVDENEYLIDTHRKSASIKIKLSKNGEDISSHTATNTFKQIEELLGMDFKTFQQLIYQSTNSSLAFLTATDTARKKFLIDLFDLSEYTSLFEVFKDASKSLGTEVTSLESRIDTINKWLANNSSVDLELKEVQELPDRPDFGTEIGDLNSKLSNIKSHNDSIKKNNLIRKQLEQIDIEELRSVDLVKESYDEYQGEIGELKSAKVAADNVVKKLKGLEDKCPTCLQDIDKVFYEDLLFTNVTSSAECEGRIQVLENAVELIKKNNRLFDTTQEQIKEWEQLNKMLNPDLQSDPLSAADIENELTAIKNMIAKVDAEITKATVANNEAMKHNSKIQVYLEQNEKFSEELKEARSQLDLLMDKYKNLEVLKKAFSTNGLIAYKLENLVKDLEEYANEYLAELSDGRFTIEFSLSSDKLNVVLTDESNEIGVSALSSGEMARVNISTLLAIRKLMQGISKSTINVLFLDEVISVLDEYGRERLVEVLLKEEGLNSFLVSHGWSHPLLGKLLIKKRDGISWIDHG